MTTVREFVIRLLDFDLDKPVEVQGKEPAVFEQGGKLGIAPAVYGSVPVRQGRQGHDPGGDPEDTVG